MDITKDEEISELRRELIEKEGIMAKPIEDSEFLTLEVLVSRIEESPWEFTEPGADFYYREGILPLIGDYNGKPVFGINMQAGDQIRNFGDIGIRLEEHVLRNLEDLEKNDIEYVLLDEEEFEALYKLVLDPIERQKFLGLYDENKYDEETPARNVFYALLKTAIKKRASDIHIERLKNNNNRVRYRIDGVLVQGDYPIPGKTIDHLVNVIKNDSGMKIDENRRPQDGSISFDEAILKKQPKLRGCSIRTSTMPTKYGEKVAIRLLQTKKKSLELASLGYPQQVYSIIKKEISVPYGLILVCGPTGSGKTTTLYSILHYRNKPDVNIITIEDPIEIVLDGINQSEINRAIGWDFSTCLRTYLRQDPDIILVGEIRDSETAKTALEAAKTGHLVLSTLHTNDAILSLLRLYELGVAHSDLQSSLKAVISQRLVRKLCGACKVSYDGRKRLNALLGEELLREPLLVYKPPKKNRCEECYHLGYKGRTVVPEIWVLGEEERQMIYDGVKLHQQYFDVAVKNGMLPLICTGLDLVLAGKTSLEELVRVAVPKDEFKRRRKLVVDAVSGYKNGK